LERRIYYRFSDNVRRHIAYEEAYSIYLKIKSEHDERVARVELEKKKQQVDFWRALSGREFEIELGKLYERMGYIVTHTPHTSDGGVDLLVEKGGKLTAIQCKAHNKRISIGVIRELCTSMNDFRAAEAIIACFDGVTRPVHEYIKDRPIIVLDVSAIVELQREYSN
jgi:HJR/Mrr/RecB family endonuclease